MKTVKVSDVQNVLDNFAPPELAMEFDNVGLIVGSRTFAVSGILVCLDATQSVLSEAKEKGCNLVVSHHPPIFKSLKSIDLENEKGKILEFAIENKISILSYHTNLDVVCGGINSYLAHLLGDGESVCTNEGVLFILKNSMLLSEFAKKVAETLGDKSLKICGDKNKIIKKVFIVGGAGGRDEDAYEFAKNNADVFVSAEMKHNLMISACADNFALIDFSHYYSENVCKEIFFNILYSAFGDMKIIKSEQKCPFWTMEEL